MSAEVDVLMQEAKESIEAAQNFRTELQQRLGGLNQARQQVRGSSTQARDALRRHFTELQAAATRLLSERLSALLAEVDAIEADSVRPLDDCQSLVEYGMGQADELLREGEAALRCGLGEKEDKLGSFTKKAMHIQLDSLPEVPALVDVPCVSAQFDDSLLVLLRERACRHGSVASHPPVLIEELQERPGSILVRWCKVDEDFAAADYRLQYRRSGSGGSQYEDAYVGHDTDFLALGLDPNTDYMFRVCARGEGRTEWSPWSVAQTGYTTMEPHEWRPGTEGYIVSSRRNIALRNDSVPSGCPVLYSNAPTYFCGLTLTFKISATGKPDRRDSLGVCVDGEKSCRSLQRDQAVCISTNGAVYVNGKEMTNQLPSITLGSAVTFDMEVVGVVPLNNDHVSDNVGNNVSSLKLRVTIGSGSREVVFDWLLDTAVDGLFFGCAFAHAGWKVLVF
ncbi:cytokine receptor-like factor 3 [Hippocampus comes]|uniref:Cytokine receptor-like factor 3 n=1 Tax=Hippocampus comes TaxID=109280 RepID=A0A3Q2YSW5_HIPCM|nr:PREDICTED: cytokine receptor-like factor 3 [Hippocampus comes]XP_019745471.1 PREDICTED: cytokine receptor-like factor 3 [Hippocampus comes]XP_019745472.1 PREDICTED: cytokine receptor-like factor 3 [Hippocampus comes]